MATKSFSPDERVECQYTRARQDAECLRWDADERAELARTAEEVGDEPLHWSKSGHSSAETGHCLEVAVKVPMVWVRDSVHPARERLGFGVGEWCSFVRGLVTSSG